MTKEIKEKLSRIRKIIREQNLFGVLLTSTPNFFWITGGKNGFVDKSTGEAIAKVLITDDLVYVICNSSERYRLVEEELIDFNFELVSYYWYESEFDVIQRLIDYNLVGSDTGIYGTQNISEEINKMRYVLTSNEKDRLKKIGFESTAILENLILNVSRGESELEIAGRLVNKLMACGYQIPVCLVASDERIFKYRHPIPTKKRVQDYLMIAICCQKYGLTNSISRLISFDKLSKDIKNKYHALLDIDATYILNTKPGVEVKTIINKAYSKYVELGYKNDFSLHHQGGSIGYNTRDYIATPTIDKTVLEGQAFSWNPTIAGVKLEDTILVNKDGCDIISDTDNWEYKNIVIDGIAVRRPEIIIK